PKSRERCATQVGLHVPRDVFKQAEAEFRLKRARVQEKLCQNLEKTYPRVPPADRNKLHRLIASQAPDMIGNAGLARIKIIVRDYVHDNYTRFKDLAAFYGDSRDTEVSARAHCKVEKILACWSG
ncbi:uncharacterized protein K460DRAFT_247971, partial [Cucurbitaria berberidis CBS 394.84]